MFRKGRTDLLCEIRRRKAWSNKAQRIPPIQPPKEVDEDQRSSSTSSSYGYTTLVDENNRLKRENRVLSSELSTMKKKCKELLDLVAMYTSLEKEEEEDDERPKLFGVRQGFKSQKDKSKLVQVALASTSQHMVHCQGHPSKVQNCPSKLVQVQYEA
ncbi:Heat stress transcription factor B-3 [Camellia lanceoleosa]|uniref:Heat stress transcription factor B-3 n=1 Tax=Camellia lanceoleosa TaxID=1840588 RepID=A0ACC0GBP0_9ERIC|nr:Heat stress transcription factor B-3 [Camellia lanceoleosa]